MPDVLEQDLQVDGGAAQVRFDATLAGDAWRALLRTAAPQAIVLEGTPRRLGDYLDFFFTVSVSLVGKSYELEVIAEGESGVVVARGEIAEGPDRLDLSLPTPPPEIFVGSVPPEDPDVNDIWIDTST